MKKLLPILALALASCSSTPPCEDDVGAFVMAQEFVKKSLRSPSTAVFPSMTESGVSSNRTTTPDGKCAFSVVLFVDAQNGFGATIRESYIVIVSPDENKGTWTLIDLTPLG